MFGRLLSRFGARGRARELAQESCRRLRPGEPILGTWLCANEPERYVVRVFLGERTGDPVKGLPRWRECLIFAVNKDCTVAELVNNDERYRPVVR
jgi:hypothetical protein